MAKHYKNNINIYYSFFSCRLQNKGKHSDKEKIFISKLFYEKHFPSEKESGMVGENWLSVSSCFIGVLVCILVDIGCFENVPF